VKVWGDCLSNGKFIGLLETKSFEQAEGIVGRLGLVQRCRVVARDEAGKEYWLRPDGKFAPIAPPVSVLEVPSSKLTHH
jgi:hypothetical protein